MAPTQNRIPVASNAECAGCLRNLEEGETGLKPNEKSLLDLICKAYYLPQWCSLNDYRRIFEAQGLQVKASTPQRNRIADLASSCQCLQTSRINPATYVCRILRQLTGLRRWRHSGALSFALHSALTASQACLRLDGPLSRQALILQQLKSLQITVKNFTEQCF